MTTPCRNTSALDAKMREDDERFNDARRSVEREAFIDHMIEHHAETVAEEVHNDFPGALGGAFGAWLEYLADGDEAGLGRLYMLAARNVAGRFYDNDDTSRFGWNGV